MANSNDRQPATVAHGAARRRGGRSEGQAMLESLLVILVASFLLFTLLELARDFAGHEVRRHAASGAARARTVGFNKWMCTKVMRVAAIPNAGKMLEPAYEDFPDEELHAALESKSPTELWDWALTAEGGTDRAEMESSRIPNYLASEHEGVAGGILDYEGWKDLQADGLGGSSSALSPKTIEVNVRQRVPLDIMVRALCDWVGLVFNRDYLVLGGDGRIENHASLYMEDKGY